MIMDNLLARDIIPDSILRFGIKTLLRKRLKKEKFATSEDLQRHKDDLIQELKTSPIALNTSEANEQHYEVPAEFYEIVLGPMLKYSSGYWPESNMSIEESEYEMLKLTIDRADIQENQSVLDLGCGWGSFSLFAAKEFPTSNFTAVSNSASQKEFIDKKAKERGIKNLTVITQDINNFNPSENYHRIISVEMFEHVRNYQMLFDRIFKWLNPEGKLFVHIFSHRQVAYKFEVKNQGDWMAKYFFTGGMMPSDDLLFQFSKDFEVLNHWNVNGQHYARTLETWLIRMDINKDDVMRIFKDTYGDEANKFWAYWRIFFMACAETFAYKTGDEWGVSHYLFQKI